MTAMTQRRVRAVAWTTLLEKARAEVGGKTPARVEAETAFTWAARAVARHEVAEALAVDCEAWRVYDDAVHEALEHAALVRDDGQTLRAIERLLAGEGR